MQRDVTPLRIEAQEIPQNFYPNRRSIISEDGEIKDDAKHRIRAKRLKQGFAFRVLYDWCMPIKLRKQNLQNSDSTSCDLRNKLLANQEIA